MKIVQNGTTPWSGFGKGDDLGFPTTEIPGDDFRGHKHLDFDACTRKGSDLDERPFPTWFRFNLADNHFWHNQLVRKLAQESDASNLTEQDQGGGIDDPTPTHARSLR